MDDRDLEVVCVSETKRKGHGTTDLPGRQIAFGASVPESERGHHGVGVILSSRLVSKRLNTKQLTRGCFGFASSWG